MVNRLFLGLCFIFSMITPVHADAPINISLPQIKDEYRRCQSDQDCQWIRTSCLSCCPGLNDSVAINKKYVKDYEVVSSCTEEHIKDCGVPECGLMSPAPAAVCHVGRCVVVMEFQGHVS